ncbi:multidrug ABC transporter ATPase [Streptomyces eurocidicus]|uniref:ABC-type multidrug transport system fused ATPase/permease subunit n=1 Tax=Streptomyces eurocidicus TaxID=66423 RepID=A0A2N8NUH6_STREU|nr:ABC transporter ATP-binding protein [Streptomyces eurocidicus]MBB5120277.1 ABC-type multidrug transport system fused ATPase/permease subunit [Streptomyces eurocidicus]MBF6056043.1 ATP-binding cassette domain-containing protein [Streptomyces eurocidicus]PNE32419.1 multidrug ABC transporter ATPase [Streptomyces eurocidicus]
MTVLPVVSSQEARRHARRLVLKYPGELATVLGLHGLSTACGLTAPHLLGGLVEDVRSGIDSVSTAALLILGFVLAQSLLLGLAVSSTARLSEKVVAELREEFLEDLLRLPLARVEEAGVGDVLTRSTRDVDALARVARYALPSTLVALTTIATTVGALLLTGWLMVVPVLLLVPVLWPVTRWYLGRAREGYLRERTTYAQAAETLTETVTGARTVEALRLVPRRTERMDRAVAETYGAQRHTLWLRSVFLPVTDTAIALPTVATVILGGLAYDQGWVSLAGVTAATLYTQQLTGQIDILLFWQDKLQVGGASLARLLGVRQEADPRPAATGSGERAPGDLDLELRGASFSYTDGRDVLHSLDLTIRQGERVAVVGPSGAGKTTLGRLLTGTDLPRAGTVTVGGVPLADIPRSTLRADIALVTQDHHIFRGSVRDNLLLASPAAGEERLREALEAVGAWGWASELGLDTPLQGAGGDLAPDRAQQLSLARLLLSDPHTLVLDEATSLLSPRSARDVERSMAAVTAGRTVVSIAHRLHTAHDADRVLVMEAGRIVEDGSHTELLEKDGAYAALWRSWHATA